MKIVLTLDYELFMGQQAGSVDNCLVRPMEQLCRSMDEAGGKFTIFVDATYLLRLKHYAAMHASADADFSKVAHNLERLRRQGHDLQLHIHPQWMYSTYDGSAWVMDQVHYKLSDLGRDECREVFGAAKRLLEEIAGDRATIFRAGGFSAQPTELLADLLARNEMTADMSVCPGMAYNSPQQRYDYTRCPDLPLYRFTDDICRADPDGRFVEIPISMHAVSPLFHWQLAFNRLVHGRRHDTYGDGKSVAASGESVKQRLTRRVSCVATIDGLKINNLPEARAALAREGKDLMCVIGHPKLATPHSVAKFAKFCRNLAKEDCMVTARELLKKLPE